MGKLVAAAVLLVIAFSVLLAAATVRSQRPGPIANLLRLAGLGAAAVALLLAIGSGMVVIDPGEVGVRHAFGYVDPAPLLAGIRLVVRSEERRVGKGGGSRWWRDRCRE